VRETHGLRVFVSGGGCSGLQYGMAFDNTPRPTDTVFQERGLRVIIDPQSLRYMAGSNIDYVDNLMGALPHREPECGCQLRLRPFLRAKEAPAPKAAVAAVATKNGVVDR